MNDQLQRGRTPVFSPQFGRTFVKTEARPGDGTNDDANTAHTVAWMKEAASQDASAPEVIAETEAATRGHATASAKAAAIFQWIKRRVRFQEDALTATLAGLPDPGSAEVLIRPADILRMSQPAGDCDDFTMLAAAMLTAAGVPARIKAIEQDASNPGYYSHVYAEALIDGRWTPFDASHGTHLGWFAPSTGKSQTWELSTMFGHTQQIGSLDWNALAQTGLNITGQILVPRLSVPQITGGSYQRTADGSVLVANNPSGTSFQLPGASAGSIGNSGGTMLLIAAVVIVGGIALMKK